MLSGAYAGAGQFGTFAPIGAEHNASGGYQVVWKDFTAGRDQYAVWTTDSNGNVLSSTPIVSSGSWYVQSLEQSFAEDLNGDGHVGAITTNVETSGSTDLVKVADSYFLYAHGTTTGPQLKLSGAYAGAGQFGTFAP